MENLDVDFIEANCALEEYYETGGTLLQDIKKELDIGQPLSKIPFDKYTVHFHRRKVDKQYAIIARMKQREEGDFYQEGDFHGSWITLDVISTHSEALDSIKRFRN